MVGLQLVLRAPQFEKP